MPRYMSLKDHVYNYISEQINSGSLGEDDRISEYQISQTLNMSRTPVREALILLSAEGYLEMLPRKGFRVKCANREKAAELYEVIGVLDGKAAALAMDRITGADIEDMRFMVEIMDTAIKKQLYSKYNDIQHEFHDKYIDICGNAELIELLYKLRRHFMRKRYAVEGTDVMFEVLTETNDQHRKLVEYFQNKDAAGAEAYLRNVHWNVEKARFEAWR